MALVVYKKEIRRRRINIFVSAIQHFQRTGFRDALADCKTQGQHRRGRHRQLIDADGEEGGQQADIRTQFAANSNPDTGGMGRVGRARRTAG